MRRRVIWSQVVVWGVVAFVAIGCAAPPLTGPQIMVTRVPLEVGPSQAVKVASAGTPGEIGDGVEAQPASTPAAASDLTVTLTTTLQTTVLVSGTAASSEISTEDIPHAEQGPPGPTEDPSLRPLQRTRNFLLLGTDQRDLDYVGRTDTIMVLAVDEGKHRAALISFPRDMYLPIPGVGYNRINVAYPYGRRPRRAAGCLC